MCNVYSICNLIKFAPSYFHTRSQSISDIPCTMRPCSTDHLPHSSNSIIAPSPTSHSPPNTSSTNLRYWRTLRTLANIRAYTDIYNVLHTIYICTFNHIYLHFASSSLSLIFGILFHISIHFSHFLQFSRYYLLSHRRSCRMLQFYWSWMLAVTHLLLPELFSKILFFFRIIVQILHLWIM